MKLDDACKLASRDQYRYRLAQKILLQKYIYAYKNLKSKR